MSRLHRDWKTLNAYVDGELTANEAAAVARDIAQDPPTAESAAALASLKSALLEQAEAPEDFQLLPAGSNPKKPAGWQALRWRALRWQAAHTAATAAALVIFIAVGALWHWSATNAGDRNSPAVAWHQEAAEIHRDWVAKKSDERPPSLDIPATAALTAPELRIPDLSDSGLTPILLEPEAQLGGMTGYRVGYGGTRGCRISFFVLQGDGGIPGHLTTLKAGGPQVLAWRHDQAHYFLMAEGMAETRFGLIARTLQNVTANWQPLSPEIRTALQQNRQLSTPCTA